MYFAFPLPQAFMNIGISLDRLFAVTVVTFGV
jgi:hypothetical protein